MDICGVAQPRITSKTRSILSVQTIPVSGPGVAGAVFARSQSLIVRPHKKHHFDLFGPRDTASSTAEAHGP